jgi:hypothetical protein
MENMLTACVCNVHAVSVLCMQHTPLVLQLVHLHVSHLWLCLPTHALDANNVYALLFTLLL